MLGVAEAALQMALAYMRTRVQFDRPIGSFQALQHKAADLYAAGAAARRRTAAALAGSSPGTGADAARCSHRGAA
ncbi:MAG: acyl-CoA dehydrogenase family protein [Rubrivivax sp.]